MGSNKCPKQISVSGFIDCICLSSEEKLIIKKSTKYYLQLFYIYYFKIFFQNLCNRRHFLNKKTILVIRQVSSGDLMYSKVIIVNNTALKT